MKRNIWRQRNAEIQSKTYISAEVFFLTCDQTFFVFFLRGGLDLITIQSNHLLGNPRYTLTEHLLANLTDFDFLKMALHHHQKTTQAPSPSSIQDTGQHLPGNSKADHEIRLMSPLTKGGKGGTKSKVRSCLSSCKVW